MSRDCQRLSANPQALLACFARHVRAAGLAGTAATLDRDGSVLLRLAGEGRTEDVRWAPPGVDHPAARAHESLIGTLVAPGLSEAEADAVGLSLASAAADVDFLAWGPPAGDGVRLSVDSLGSLVRRQIVPDETTWGPFVFREVVQAGPDALEFRFDSAGESPEEVVIRLFLSPGASLPARRRDLSFARVRDTRDPATLSRRDRQVERLLGFAVGRALGHDPFVEPAGGATPSSAPSGPAPGRSVLDIDKSRYLELFQARVRHEAFIRRWDAPDRWRRFLYPMNRCVAALFRLGPTDHLVVHETLECVLNEPPWLPADTAFFGSPRDSRVGNYWQRGPTRITDPRAGDAVAGRSQSLLEEAVEEAAASPGATAVVVVSGCLPDLIGDNPVPVFQRMEKRFDARLYWVAATNDYGGYTARLIGDRLKRVAPADHRRDPLGVALVGGGRTAENEELLELVAGIGLHPLGVVLPDVDFDAFRRVADASLFAWARQTTLSDVSEVAFTELPVTLLRPRAPVGVKGTLAWLGRIADHAPPGSGAGEALEALGRERPWEAEVEPLRRRAARWNVAFVTDAEEFEVLADTSPAFAFPLLDAVLDMGFGIRLLNFGAPAASDAQRAWIAGGREDRVSVAHFEDPAGLRRLLAAPDVGVVYSHFAADPRVTAVGKTVFTEAWLEMGFRGFARSIRALLRACETRPLAGFERWLGEGP